MVDNTLYIQNPLVVGKLAIYLSPSLSVSSLSETVFPSLLKTTRSVEVWSSLLPRFTSLSPSEIKKLVIFVDQAVTIKADFKTPFKSNSSTVDSSMNLGSSFVVDKTLILSDNSLHIPVQDIDLLFPILCTRINSLAQRSDLLRPGFTNLKSIMIDDFNKIASRVSLLHNKSVKTLTSMTFLFVTLERKLR